ncbi:MAG: hypothetical protein ABIF09_04560 [Gemmatimonadota bacterium]
MTLERSTRARLTTALILFLVLASGVVLGMALDRQLEARAANGGEFRRPEGRPGMDGRSRGLDPRSGDSPRDPSQARDSSQRGPSLIVEQVGLSEVQKQQVDSILVYYRGQMRALHEEFNESYMTRYQEITRATRDEIKAILTVEQQAAYDSLLVEWDRRRESRGRDSVSSTGGGRNGR